VERLHEGAMEAMVLAAAGLTRLGMAEHITVYMDPDRFLPAPGQGIVTVQLRAGDDATHRHVSRLDHAPSRGAAEAERTFLNRLGGGCLLRVGAHAEVEAGTLRLHAGRQAGCRAAGGLARRAEALAGGCRERGGLRQ